METKESVNEFAEFCTLLHLFTDITNRLNNVCQASNAAYAKAVQVSAVDYATLTTTLKEAEDKLVNLAAAHPEWKDGESVKTPFGSVQFKNSLKFQIKNPETVIFLIKTRVGPKSDVEEFRRFVPADFIRTTEEPNLETLGALDDAHLAKLGLLRTRSTSITIKAADVDIAKATKPKSNKKEKVEA